MSELDRLSLFGWVESPHTLVRTEHEAISEDLRKELLEASYAGKHVEVLLDAITYVQTPGVPNRNFVRFREEHLAAMAATGVNKPFLINHAQHDHKQKGGMWIASEARREGTSVAFHQTARLSKPWAVQEALQGLYTHFSIGWRPLPPPGTHEPALTCSLCQAPVRLCIWEKRHFRGSVHGAHVIEWIEENAELLEASGVPVPGEARTRAIGVRPAHDLAQLEAELRFFGLATPPPPRPPTPTGPRAQEQIMDTDNPTHSPEASIEASQPAATKTLEHKVEALSSTVQELAKTVNGTLQTLLGHAQEAQAKARGAEVQTLLDAAIQDGRLPADGPVYQLMRERLLADPDSGQTLLAAMPRQTSAGAPRQSDNAQPRANTNPDAQLQAALEADADELKVVKRSGLALEDYVRVNRTSLLNRYRIEA